MKSRSNTIVQTMGFRLVLWLVAVVMLVAGLLAGCTTEPGPGDPGGPSGGSDGHDLGFDGAEGLPSELLSGRANDFTVDVVNFGTRAATNVVLTISGPLQLTLDGSVDGSSCDANNDGQDTSTLTCVLGTVEPVETVTVDVEAWVGEWSGARDVTYAVTADGAEPSPDPHPNSVTVVMSIGTVPVSVPTIGITSPDPSAVVDDTMTIDYSATASDDNDGDLSDQITWSYRSDDPNASDVDLGTGTSGTFGPLAAGSYTLTASVTNSDGQSATDSVSLTVELGPPAEYDLGVFIPNLPPVIPVGEHVTFPVVVHNFGTKLSTVYALGVSTSSQFNATIVLGGGMPSSPDQNLFPLGAGASRTFMVDITATDATPGTVTLTAYYYMGQGGSPEPAKDRHPNSVTGTTTGGVIDLSVPTLEIDSPATTPLSMPLDFITTDDLSTSYSATADDTEDGDISAQIDWSIRPLIDPNATWSDVSTGASGTLDPLTPGVYLLRASVTDSDGNQASSTLTITNLPAGISCSTTIDFRPVSGLYLPQIMTVNTSRSYETCGRKLQFYYDAVYTAVSEEDRLAFNEMMNNEDHSMMRGNFVIHKPDEWIVNLEVCLPAAGSIPAKCELPVSRDWAVADVVIP